MSTAEIKAAKVVAFLDANRDEFVRRIEERWVAEAHRMVNAAARELLSELGGPNALSGAHALPVDSAGDDLETSESSEDSAGDDSDTSSTELDGSEPPQG